MASTANSRRARSDNTIVTVVLVAVVVLAAALLWLSATADDRFSSLTTGQSTGRAERTDQQQVTCALWALLRADPKREVPSSVRTAADRICGDLPTPLPTENP